MPKLPPVSNTTDADVLKLIAEIGTAHSKYNSDKAKPHSRLPELDDIGLNNLDIVIGKLWAMEEGKQRNMLYIQLSNQFQGNKANINEFNNIMVRSGTWHGIGTGQLKFQEGRTGEPISVSTGVILPPPDVVVAQEHQKHPTAIRRRFEEAQSFDSTMDSRPSTSVPSAIRRRFEDAKSFDSSMDSRPSTSVPSTVDLVTGRATRSGPSISSSDASAFLDEVVHGGSSIFDRPSSNGDTTPVSLPPIGHVKAHERLGQMLDDAKRVQTQKPEDPTAAHSTGIKPD